MILHDVHSQDLTPTHLSRSICKFAESAKAGSIRCILFVRKTEQVFMATIGAFIIYCLLEYSQVPLYCVAPTKPVQLHTTTVLTFRTSLPLTALHIALHMEAGETPAFGTMSDHDGCVLNKDRSNWCSISDHPTFQRPVVCLSYDNV